MTHKGHLQRLIEIIENDDLMFQHFPPLVEAKKSLLVNESDYWKKRCEAAEGALHYSEPPLGSSYNYDIYYDKWQELKNQQP